jgi:hypothetical protein
MLVSLSEPFWELSSEHDTQRLPRTSTVRARQRSLSWYARQRAHWLVWTSLCPPQDTETIFALHFPLQLFHLLQHPVVSVSLPTLVLISTAIASDPLPGPSSTYLISSFFTFEHFEFFDGSGIISFDHWCVCACAHIKSGLWCIIAGTLNICNASDFGSLTACIQRV